MKKNLISMKRQNAIYVLAIAFIFPYLLLSCKKDKGDDFTVDFNYEYLDDNRIRLTNSSEGEYYYLFWNFGNGETDTTTDKKKFYTMYYPTKGDYTVTLKITNYTGVSESISKTVNIDATDLNVSFTTDIDPLNPNRITLTNTSVGEFDSFKWKYRHYEIENEMEYLAWFPFAGTYDIELEVLKDGNPISVSQSISITQDDPNYAENLTLKWSDEFDGNVVNTSYWTYQVGANGWGNNELQYYTEGENSDVLNGKLIITARKVNDNYEPGSYTSTRMITKSKQEFQYGRMEVRAKLPSGTGIWPAIWMLGSNYASVGWPACGEIDIMEYVGYLPNTVHATIHTIDGHGGNGNGNSYELLTCEEEFHNYGIIWTEHKIAFYVDETDNIIHTYAPAVKTPENWPFDQAAYFILNIAVGGDWGGAQGIDNSIFPQTMEIDYVRVYQE
jgi:beta-glucanase (GH16 family)